MCSWKCITVLVLLAILPQIGRSWADGPIDAAKARQIDALFGFWDRDDRPGATVAVARGGRLLFMRGYGLANVAHRVPNGPDTVFNAGSIAKQFTAFAVHRLAREGRLSLDDDVTRYIPELPVFKRKITIRHLIHHTSGIRDFWALTDLAGWHPDDVRTKAQFFEMLARQVTLNFDPGSGFSYSNSGYILLAEIIQRVTGEPFSSWITRDVFAPLGMTDTRFRASIDEILSRSAASYAWRGKEAGFRRSVDVSGTVGSGNLYTTVSDLVQWGDNLISGIVGGVTLSDRMREQGEILGAGRTGYASGLFIGSLMGLETISHGGASAGYRAHLLVLPERGLVIAILANASNVRPDIAAQKIAAIVLGEDDGRAPPSEGQPDRNIELHPVEAYVGRYELANGSFYDIKAIANGLILQPSGGAPRLLTPLTVTRFASEEAGVTISFSSRKKGRFERISVGADGRAIKGKRLSVRRLTSRQAKEYEGRYECDELGATFRLIYAQGALLMRRPRVADVAISAIGEDRFYDEETGEIVIRFQRNPREGIRGLGLSTERARRLFCRKR